MGIFWARSNDPAVADWSCQMPLATGGTCVHLAPWWVDTDLRPLPANEPEPWRRDHRCRLSWCWKLIWECLHKNFCPLRSNPWIQNCSIEPYWCHRHDPGDFTENFYLWWVQWKFNFPCLFCCFDKLLTKTNSVKWQWGRPDYSKSLIHFWWCSGSNFYLIAYDFSVYSFCLPLSKHSYTLTMLISPSKVQTVDSLKWNSIRFVNITIGPSIVSYLIFGNLAVRRSP